MSTRVWIVTDSGTAPLDDHGAPLDDFDWVPLGVFRSESEAEILRAKTLFVCPDHDVQVQPAELYP